MEGDEWLERTTMLEAEILRLGWEVARLKAENAHLVA